MSVATTQTIIPARAFTGIVFGLAFVVAVVGAMRLAGYGPSTPVDDQPLASLVLKVEDAANGTVVVRNASTGEVIQEFHRAEGSFLRATFRALVNDRRRKGTTEQGDFRLEQHANGRLYLIDEATGKRLTLNAYGPDNSAVFAAFMSNQKGEGQ